MDSEQIKSMDPYMLLSIVNMKLRDEYSDFEEFCGQYDVPSAEIFDKLRLIGYKYSKETNQFINI